MEAELLIRRHNSGVTKIGFQMVTLTMGLFSKTCNREK